MLTNAWRGRLLNPLSRFLISTATRFHLQVRCVCVCVNPPSERYQLNDQMIFVSSSTCQIRKRLKFRQEELMQNNLENPINKHGGNAPPTENARQCGGGGGEDGRARPQTPPANRQTGPAGQMECLTAWFCIYSLISSVSRTKRLTGMQDLMQEPSAPPDGKRPAAWLWQWR